MEEDEEDQTTTRDLHIQIQQSDRYTTSQQRRRRRQQDAALGNTSLDLWSAVDVAPSGVRSNIVWPCVAVFITLWLFVSIFVILGLYGTWTSLQLGPNCSLLIKPNPLFVQSVQALQIEGIPGLMLYGMDTAPVLDVKTTWTETHNASIQPNFHKEWMYYLNTGSKLDIKYYVKNPSPSSLMLVVAQGKESLINWIEEPAYPNSTLLWNRIYGSGRIEHEITTSSNYYIAVGNFNSDTDLEVELNLTIKALLYNISQAYIKCSLYNRVCSFSLMFLTNNALVLTSPGRQKAKDDDYGYIKLSYRPRWFTYILVSGVLTIAIFLVITFRNLFQQSHVEGDRTGAGLTSDDDDDNEEPFLSNKDDDHSSWGSSYDSGSNDEEDKMEDKEFNTLKSCVLCFVSPRDCFFLPCGHCAACLTCGSRIVEEAGCCLVCQRRIKKVRKIILV
ncbi:hypothetical protein V2J09_017075 [Rumex salicifolius]